MNEAASLPFVIDAHQHYWNPAKVEYPWLTPDAGVIYDVFEAETLQPLLRKTGVTHTIAVQSANSIEDTRYLLDCAAAQPWIAGVVGWVPLEDPAECERALDALSADPAFCGVRHLIHFEADPDWIVRPSVLDGLAILADRRIPFDLVAIWPDHLRHAERILSSAPTLRLVVDHLGKPDLSKGIEQGWVDDLRAVAQLPGVHAKFSGLNTPYTHPGDWRWQTEHFSEALAIAIDLFGIDRLMWGGDWPISIQNGGYVSWYRAARAAAGGLTDTDQARLFGGTAASFYSRTAEMLAK